MNRRDEEIERSLVLGDFEVKQTEKCKYIDVFIDENRCERTINERVSRAMRANEYDVVREVWKGVAVQNIMYDMDVMVWNKRDVDMLEV